MSWLSLLAAGATAAGQIYSALGSFLFSVITIFAKKFVKYSLRHMVIR